MELFLDNVGIIGSSSIKIDGLTVITGKNSSGKTTIGKVLYSIIRANSNIEKAYEKSKTAYIISQLNRIGNIIVRRRSFISRHSSYYLETQNESHIFNILAGRNYLNADFDELMQILYDVKVFLANLTLDEYNSYFVIKEIDKESLDTVYEEFSERKQKAIELCTHTLEVVEESDSYQEFVFDRTKAFLNLSFHNQIKPIKKQRSVAHIKMTQKERIILNLKIKNKTDFEFGDEGSYVFPYSNAVFIDNPFIIDQTEDDVFRSSYYVSDRLNSDSSISPIGITTHNDHLESLLRTTANVNFFDDMEFKKKYHSVFEKINQIVPGEFQRTSTGAFYVDDGAKLSVQNLATGSKLFFILKILMMNGYLNNETLLILDEPESHLHPEWINKFAEILIVLIKEIGIHVVLTTHSPNLLLALNVYSKDYEVSDYSHFYLAKTGEKDWHSELKCIDENISEGYSHLSIPLIEMSIKQEEEE